MKKSSAAQSALSFEEQWVDAPPAAMASQLPADWRVALAEEVDKPYFKALDAFVSAERARHSVFPEPEQTFAALNYTPLQQVRVVLLGQDPYPTKGNANGLAFSVNSGMRVPQSLKNMYTVMSKDVGATPHHDGNLEQWARRGVLLLNTVLTVREGEPNSHRKQGWEIFTEAVVQTVNRSARDVVFLLLGAQAHKLAERIDATRHVVVMAPHPSPMNSVNFLKSRPFSAVNSALEARGREKIDWQLR